MERDRYCPSTPCRQPTVFESLQDAPGGYDPELLTLVCGLLDSGVIYFDLKTQQIPARIIA